jgi:hypothetical protein
MQVVQSHPVPHTALLDLWRQGIANLGKGRLQGLQAGKLLGVCVQRNANDGIHIRRILTTSYMNISWSLKKVSNPS